MTRIPKTPGSNPRVFIFVVTCKILLMVQRSSTSQYPVFYPIFHRVSKTSQVVQDFFHQQYDQQFISNSVSARKAHMQTKSL